MADDLFGGRLERPCETLVAWATSEPEVEGGERQVRWGEARHPARVGLLRCGPTLSSAPLSRDRGQRRTCASVQLGESRLSSSVEQWIEPPFFWISS